MVIKIRLVLVVNFTEDFLRLQIKLHSSI